MTKQEAFDKAVKGLAAQGFTRAVRETAAGGEACVYLTDDGKRCAYGHLMSDEFLAKLKAHGEMSSGAGGILDVYGPKAPGYDLGSDFLFQLQECHDDGHDPSTMKARLRAFATDYGLTLPAELA